MKPEHRFKWLPEVVEDMVDFCQKNDLEASRLILSEANEVILKEIAENQYDGTFDTLNKETSDKSEPPHSEIIEFETKK